MHRVYVSIGSNINRHHHITSALDALHGQFSPLSVSKVYDCVPIGFTGDNFYNLVVGFDCQCSVAQLSSILRTIEDQNDRVRSGPKFSSRTLDIDILIYDDAVGNIDGVTLPRDEITENAFVLLPLVDVAADERHPRLKHTYRELWQCYNQASQQLSQVSFLWQGKKLS